MDVGFLLHFIVTLGDEALGQVDGATAGQVQVRIKPSRCDNVQGRSASEIGRNGLKDDPEAGYCSIVYTLNPGQIDVTKNSPRASVILHFPTDRLFVVD